MSSDLNNAKHIKCIVLDVDGVMTDGQIVYTAKGEQKSFYVKDGLGIVLAIKSGMKFGIITARESEIVKQRAKELKINDVYTGQRNKLEAYKQIKEDHNLEDHEIAYMGDDLIDLPVLKKCGLSAAPQDAVDEVKNIVDFVAQKNGGRGAVRELIDYILKAQNNDDDYMSKLL